MGAWQMAILLLIVVAGLLTAFFLVWKKDKNRSHGVADDGGRLDPEARKRHDSARRRH